MTLPEHSNSERLLRLLSVRLLQNGKWVDLAFNAPAGFDRQGSFVDLGPSLREAFGGGVQAWVGAELKLRVRWVLPPPPDGED